MKFLTVVRRWLYSHWMSCQVFILHYRRFKIFIIFLPYSIISLVPYGEKKFDKVNLSFMFLGFGGDQMVDFSCKVSWAFNCYPYTSLLKPEIKGQKTSSEVTCDITHKAIIFSNIVYSESNNVVIIMAVNTLYSLSWFPFYICWVGHSHKLIV